MLKAQLRFPDHLRLKFWVKLLLKRPLSGPVERLAPGFAPRSPSIANSPFPDISISPFTATVGIIRENSIVYGNYSFIVVPKAGVEPARP